MKTDDNKTKPENGGRKGGSDQWLGEQYGKIWKEQYGEKLIVVGGVMFLPRASERILSDQGVTDFAKENSRKRRVTDFAKER